MIKSAVTLMEGSSVSVREAMCWTRMRGAVWVCVAAVYKEMLILDINTQE